MKPCVFFLFCILVRDLLKLSLKEYCFNLYLFKTTKTTNFIYNKVGTGKRLNCKFVNKERNKKTKQGKLLVKRGI